MADGSVSKKYGIPTHRPAQLGSGTSLNQEQLLQAFRLILSGKKPRPLVDDNGKPIKAAITFEGDGSARLKTAAGVFSFGRAGLLSPNQRQRLDYLEGYLSGSTIATKYADQLRAKVGASDLSDEEFLNVVEVLSTSQESFLQAIKARTATRDLSNSDLLPDDCRYWDSLIAPCERSTTLAEFLVAECRAERSALMKGDIRKAFFAISLSFCAPGTVPVEQFREVSPDALMPTLERASALPDHFAVTGAFEICADWIGRDSRATPIGVKLLDQLFSDMERLKQRCAFYAGVFVMTLARLAQHEVLRRKTAFWRRVTTAAHASLVLRACGAENGESLFKWAMEQSGKLFLFSVALEGREEPRWRPDWLTSIHLIADAVGRAAAAVEKIPKEMRPEVWAERISQAREWISSRNAELMTMFPAIGESARRKTLLTEVETGTAKPLYDEFVAAPSAQTLLMCGPAFFTIGLTVPTLRSCHLVIDQLKKEAARWSANDTQYVLQLLSFAAMQAQDVSLANKVADFCMEKARELPHDDTTLELVWRIIECASSYADKTEAMTFLSRRLETISILVQPSTLPDLHDSLVHLQLLDPVLSPGLGRAVAACRLGRMAA